MKILFFGRLADSSGREVELDLPAEGCTVAELRRRLAGALPQAAGELTRPSIRACIDLEVAPETARVMPGQEVAFLPPLSGG